VKIINIKSKTKFNKKHVNREMLNLYKLKGHPHIINVKCIMKTNKHIYIFMELAQGGDLYDYVTSHEKLSEKQSRKYFHQLIFTIKFCHDKGICHRDIKTDNILLDKNENIKLSDFGFSGLVLNELKLNKSFLGTPFYAAPEILDRTSYNGAATDIRACGVTLFTMVTGHYPFHAENIETLVLLVKNIDLKYPEYLSPELRRLFEKIFILDPEKRATINDIQNDEWFNFDKIDEELDIYNNFMKKKSLDNFKATRKRSNSITYTKSFGEIDKNSPRLKNFSTPSNTNTFLNDIKTLKENTMTSPRRTLITKEIKNFNGFELVSLLTEQNKFNLFINYEIKKIFEYVINFLSGTLKKKKKRFSLKNIFSETNNMIWKYGCKVNVMKETFSLIAKSVAVKLKIIFMEITKNLILLKFQKIKGSDKFYSEFFEIIKKSIELLKK